MMFELWLRNLMRIHQVDSPTWYAQYTQQTWEECKPARDSEYAQWDQLGW